MTMQTFEKKVYLTTTDETNKLCIFTHPKWLYLGNITA